MKIKQFIKQLKVQIKNAKMRQKEGREDVEGSLIVRGEIFDWDFNWANEGPLEEVEEDDN